MTWAANALASGDLPSSSHRLVLIAMAEPADVGGHHTFLSHATIAERTGLKERAVARIVKDLRELGFIERAEDQGPVGYIRADRRPVVYDLAIHRRHVTGGTPSGPRGVADGMSSEVSRGTTHGRHGVPPVTDEPRTKPTTEPNPLPPSPISPVLAQARAANDQRADGSCRRCDGIHPAGTSCQVPARDPTSHAAAIKAALRSPQPREDQTA